MSLDLGDVDVTVGDAVLLIFRTRSPVAGTVQEVADTVLVDVAEEFSDPPVVALARNFVVPLREHTFEQPMPADLRMFRVGSAAALDALQLAPNIVLRPQQSAFVTRQRPHAVSWHETLPPAAIPGWSCELPPNTVGTKYTSAYLDPGADLQPGNASAGTLLEYETHWEPIGWAFDQWIDTTTMAPNEDTAVSTTAVTSMGEASSRADQQSLDETSSRASTSAETAELMRQATNATATSRGVQLGVGGSRANGQSLSLDPIVSLTHAVTGTFQLGFSAARSNATADIAGQLSRRLTSGLEEAAAQARRTHAASLATDQRALHNDRRLRALQNLPADATLNLALFSIVRVWLVRTAHVRTRPVVFVPIQDHAKEFDETEVFVHRALLRGVLLDPDLVPDLDHVATEFAGPRRAAPGTDGAAVVGVIADYRLTRAAKQDKARLEMQLVSDGGDALDGAASFTVGAQPTGPTERVRIELHRPLSELRALTIRQSGGGWALGDRSVVLSDLTLTAELADGTTVELAREPEVRVERDEKHRLDFARVKLVDARNTRQRDRVLTHLNAHLLYYRLALDLQRDSTSRYQLLSARPELSPRPADMNPVGVAGMHLAFITDGDVDTTLGEVVSALVPTPEGGTFLELLPGRAKTAPAASARLPTVTAPKDTTLTWPEIVKLDTVSPPAFAAAAAAPPATEGPDAGAAEIDPAALKALLEEVKTMLATAQTDAGKAADGTKSGATTDSGTTPQKPDDPAAGAPPAADAED